MKKLTVDVNVRLQIDIDEDQDLGEVIDEMYVCFSADPDTDATVKDYEITSVAVTDSR